jgi:hypothetical protein
MAAVSWPGAMPKASTARSRAKDDRIITPSNIWQHTNDKSFINKAERKKHCFYY